MKRDKVFHIGGGAMSAVAVIVLCNFGARFGLAWAAIAGAMLVGICYELQQKIRGEGEPSWEDAAATALGGAFVAVLWGVL